MTEYGAFIGGEWVDCDESIIVYDKYTGRPVGSVGHATEAIVSHAVDVATEEAAKGPLPVERRAEILETAATLLAERLQDLVDVHTAETGFTLRDSEADCRRAVRSLRICAEESKRIVGEVVPIDWYPGAEAARAYTTYGPIGVVCAITPFNSPLNTVIHKVAPALAAGNTVVLKPAVPTPLMASAVCDIFSDAGLPPGHLNTVFGGAEVGDLLLRDERCGFYAFTGSTSVGRHITETVGMRRCQLELGSNAATIACDDADIDRVVAHVSRAGFRKAGQVCTSVQRLLVQDAVYDEVVDKLVDATNQLIAGDPRDAQVVVGPMISKEAADRAWAKVEAAVSAGARLLTGGRLDGAVVAPTVLVDVDSAMAAVAEEMFAPVVSVMRFSTIDDAIDMANDSPFGLAAGVFTDSLATATATASRLQVGTVQINASSSNRFDSMPFGGVKLSGYGKEGPRYAIRAMSDEKLIVIN